MKTTLKLVVASAIAVAGIAHAATVDNLVVNGGFEEGNALTVSDGQWLIFGSNREDSTNTRTGLDGWETTNGIEVRNNTVGTGFNSPRYVELDANNNSEMWQEIKTIKDVVYKLSFMYSPRIGEPSNSNGIDVLWNDVNVGNTTPTVTGTGGSSNVWTRYTFWVVGRGLPDELDELRFAATGLSNSKGGNVDGIELTATPLPGAALLFGTSIAGFLAARKRRKAAALAA